MKKTLYLICAALLLFSFKTDNIKNSLALSNLKGNVKSVSETVYAVQTKLGVEDKGKLLEKDSSLYNDKGNITVWKQFDGNGALKKMNTNTYNDIDKVIAETVGNGKSWFKDTMLYDGNGNPAELDIFKPKGKPAKWRTFKYEGDYMTEEDIYFHNKLISKAVNNYNDNGKIFLINVYKSGSDVSSKIAFTYDDNGNISKEETYDEHGKLKYKVEYKYSDFDTAGNWIKRSKYYNDKPASITEREIAYY